MSKFLATFVLPDYPDDSYNLFFRPKGTLVRTPHGVFAEAMQTQDKYVVQKNGDPEYDAGGYSIERDTFAAAWQDFHDFTADLDRLYTR
jgi:hypothetical protein